MRATVVVRPKDGILDPQGEAVLGALRHLDFTVDDVRIGRVIDIELDAEDAESAQAEVRRMCDQLLANPLIESFDIEVSG
jgi:phosphoribosylformylglycinamidine synthase